MVRNLATNFVSSQLYVIFVEKFSTTQNDTMIEYTTVGEISNELFTNCRDFYGDDGRPSKETISDPERDAVDIPS